MKPPEQTRLAVFDILYINYKYKLQGVALYTRPPLVVYYFFKIKNRVVVRTSEVCRRSRRSGLKKNRGCFEQDNIKQLVIIFYIMRHATLSTKID